jgi:FkbM family methyltransferase
LRRKTIETLPPTSVVVRFFDDARFRFAIHDHYWSRLLLRGYEYEPAIAALLRMLAPNEYGFIDCGANFGYWSVLASSREFGSKPTLSIEASVANVELLEQNAALNEGRFVCWNKAVSSHSGELVPFFCADGVHYGASLRRRWHDGAIPEMVSTVTIDDAAAYLRRARNCKHFVVKLDVEGAECDALAGATDTLAGGALVIYEDHPRDAAHTATSFMLNAGMTVLLLTTRGAVRIRTLEDLGREKQRRDYEYNLAACSAGSWAGGLLSSRSVEPLR